MSEDEAPAIIWAGCNGYRLDAFDDHRVVERIKRRAVRSQNSFMNTDAPVVNCAHERNGYLWLPRFFDPEIELDGWDEDQTTMGEAAVFNFRKKPWEKRGQVKACADMIEFLKEHSGGILRAYTGCGKCLGRGTEVVMADGSIKAVEDVVEDDLLMGPDGKPKKVMSTTRGFGPLYKIKPNKGEPWVCNDAHILTLVHTRTGVIKDVPLQDWLQASTSFKHLHKQFSVGIDDFLDDPDPLKVDPYFMGLWFGDGTKLVVRDKLSRVDVTNIDPEVLEELEIVADRWGLSIKNVSVGDRTPTYKIFGERFKKNPLLEEMRSLLGSSLKIPDEVMRGSRSTRLAFLAGFLDSDGHYVGGTFTITQKRLDWARCLWRLARSLGFYSSFNVKKVKSGQDCYRLCISGDIDQIPTKIKRKKASPRKQKKDPTRTGFEVESLGEGEYFGFTLDGDGRFLLGDYTVTHNTFMSLWIAGHFGRKIGIVVHKKHQIKDWVKEILESLHMSREDIGIVQGNHCHLGKPITIMMCGSLISSRQYPRELYEQFGVLIADEVHRYGAPEWNKVFYQFPAYYRMGLSATPERDDGLDDIVWWHFGSEGVGLDKPGGLQKPTVYQILYRVEYDPEDFYNQQLGCNDANSYYRLLMNDEARNRVIALNIVKARRKGRTILVLTHRKKHVRDLHALIQAAANADGDCKRTITSILMGGAKDSEIDRAKRSDIIVSTFEYLKESYNDPRIDTLAFAMPPGKPEQPIGRLRDVESPGKQKLVAMDFFEEGGYSEKKASYRRKDYNRLLIPVEMLRQKPMTEEEFWDQITPKRFGEVKGTTVSEEADDSWFGGDA